MADGDLSKRMDRLRDELLGNMSSGDLLQMQLKVDTLVRLAMLDGEHHHDSQGGVGHHDHSSLADLSWQLERPQAVDIISREK
ncbi:hypothetical protein HHL11_05515 [Ramlibacter sp. G-1-2-2]|uniref:Uncharacterized protein n=1 Tax=Ramlibacter agri TaxID=2728837 RepID=A0A848H0Z0_9BURK|nr:hypothetical protein [Ramlibacter agri]NML43199.1 hypothetical protein [Ramlibacter agri]